MKMLKIAARDPLEDHRSATMLESFFDLVTVVAIAATATGFHHMYAEGHILEAILVLAVATKSLMGKPAMQAG